MRRLIHALIVAYLRRCYGAFHHFPYGPQGRYVVLMREDEYDALERVRLARRGRGLA